MTCPNLQAQQAHVTQNLAALRLMDQFVFDKICLKIYYNYQ